jgi:16S rRNA (cytosine1402-N4)-methyltransferase
LKNEEGHVPVLLGPVVEALRPRPGALFLDGTVGLGGHAFEILSRSGPDGRLLGIDKDSRALAGAAERLKIFGDRSRLGQGDFSRFDEIFPEAAESALDGALVDLGVSSLQLDEPGRGFSFQSEGPLDMRMDPSGGETAADFLERATEQELVERLREAGEDRFAAKLARRLLERRGSFKTTRELAEAVARMVPRRGKTHPATRVFLALRMAVNRESDALRDFMRKIPRALRPGGRLVIISFHSTEDRIAKRFYSDVLNLMDEMKRVTRKPVAADEEERRRNPRSRSAKMRVFERHVV